MAYRNRVELMGNLGADPSVRYMPNGDCVANIRLATTETYKDRTSGEKKERTEWHRVVLYRGLAETANRYLKKGSSIFIDGKLRTRKWVKDGVDHYTTEIEADEMQMLGNRSPTSAGSTRPAAGPDEAPPHGDDGDPFISRSISDDSTVKQQARSYRGV